MGYRVSQRDVTDPYEGPGVLDGSLIVALFVFPPSYAYVGPREMPRLINCVTILCPIIDTH